MLICSCSCTVVEWVVPRSCCSVRSPLWCYCAAIVVGAYYCYCGGRAQLRYCNTAPPCGCVAAGPPLLAAGAVVPRCLACRGDVLYRKFAASSRRFGFVVKEEENTEIKEKKTVSAPPLTPEQRRNGNTPRWTPTLRHNNGRGRRGREGQRELS